jgi:hypothetical protein
MTGGILVEVGYPVGSGTYEFRSFICSSTLIAPDVVMAAAHCVDDLVLNYSMLGTTSGLENITFWWTRQANLTDFDGTQMVPSDWPDDAVKVKEVVWHPKWDFFDMQNNLGVARNQDIALLFLKTPVLDVPLGILPTEEEALQIEVDTEVFVVGWGQQEATGMNQALEPGSYAKKRWGTSFIAELGPSEFQVGLEEADTRKCHGDSGGPSFMEIETTSSNPLRLIGVTSHSYDYTDCFLTGGVDTRVDKFLEWIDEELVAGCADGTRSWCETDGIVPAPWPDGTDGWLEPPVAGCSVVSWPGISGSSLLLAAALIRRRRQEPTA